jgi:DMSO/TMAO reductase YedYZ molybdopterin-dependent catalytic subunit
MEPLDRRGFLRGLGVGTAVIALGGSIFAIGCDEKARRMSLELGPNGKSRLPPGQYLLEKLRPMGGQAGDSSAGKLRLRVHGEVDNPLELDFATLLTLPQTEQTCDVHCVTKWTVLDARFKGVRVAHLAQMAKVRKSARFVIFEAAHGYTANVELEEAMKPNVLVAHEHEGNPIALPHGPPVRALVPDRYFWKSAKWLTGIRFSAGDEPGYWEVRGYHNHADPWKEERTSFL